MFKRSSDGAIVCRHCLPPSDLIVSVELMPHLFPGTYERLTCTDCGNTPAQVEAMAADMAASLSVEAVAGPVALEDTITPEPGPVSGLSAPRSRLK